MPPSPFVFHLLFRKAILSGVITLFVMAILSTVLDGLSGQWIETHQQNTFRQQLFALSFIVSAIVSLATLCWLYWVSIRRKQQLSTHTSTQQPIHNDSNVAPRDTPTQSTLLAGHTPKIRPDYPTGNSAINILIVDDNAANRLILDRFLQKKGIDTILARNGIEAVDAFQQQAFHLVLMDIEMLGMNGLDATKEIRKIENTWQSKRTPIVGISAHSAQEKMHEALLAGLDDYIVKPIGETGISDALERWCDYKKEKPIETQDIEMAIIDASRKEASSSPSGTDPSTINKVVDIQQSLEHSHQNKSLAKDMLDLLITMIEDEKANISRLYEQKNWQALAALTHKLYGGCCYCGVPELQQACEKADKQLQQQRYDNLEPMINKLLNAMNDILLWNQQFDTAVIFDCE